MSTHTTLITGGAGFIGSHLAELLTSRGRRVVLIDDLSTGRSANVAHLPAEQCELVHGRVSDVLMVRPELLDGVEQVYHLAASVGVQLVVDDPAAIIRNNVTETAALLDAAESVGAAVLIASSSEVYGKSDRVPLREDGDLVYGPTTGARWSYALSKAMDEHLALSYDVRGKDERNGGARSRERRGGEGDDGARRGSAVIVRLFNTIGPRQVGRYGMVVPRFVAAAVAGQDLQVYGDGGQTRAFCDVRDVVGAMVQLLDEPAHHGQVYNVGSDEEITINALAERVIALAGSQSRVAHVPYDQAYRPGFEDPFRRRVPELSKIRGAIGFSRRYSLERTLEELIKAAR